MNDFSLEENVKPFAVVAAFLALAALAVAEDKPSTKVVRVTGTSEVRVAPDRAVIEVGVEKQAASASVAKHAEDAAARRILDSLRANGVDEKDIQTTYLSLQPRAVYVKKVRVTYFSAEQSLTVTVRDLNKLELLLESLVKAGGNQISSVQYQTSDLRKYRDQARDLAVKAAREKAKALAQALGQDIGKAHAIEEMADLGDQIIANSSVAFEAERSKSSPSLAPGQKTISASVVVSFDLI
jgi:uncharacterized protein YggE